LIVLLRTNEFVRIPELLTLAGRSDAALAAGMKLGHSSIFKVMVCRRTWGLAGMNQLVSVVIHLAAALGANHRRCRHCVTSTIQWYLFASKTQSLGHPNEFLQKLVNASDKGVVQQSAFSREHVLHAGKVNVPENCH